MRRKVAKGDGSFQPAILSAGSYGYLQSITVGDFNRDGILDVAAATDCNETGNCSSGTLEIFLGRGDGTFSGGGAFALNGTVGSAGTIAAGDFNGDGNLDIAVGVNCYGSPCQTALEIFFGTGTGGFTGPNVITTSLGGFVYPVVRDFNGDGKLDIVAATPAANLAVFLGNGDGTFKQNIVTLPPNTFAYAITAADLNSDGKLDLVLAGDYVQVLFGNGDGTFQSPISYSYPAGNGTSSVVAADINADGHPDLIVGDWAGNPNFAALLLNDGQGNFGAATEFSLGGWASMAVVVGDFNGDGKADMVGVSGCPQIPTYYVYCPDSTISVLLGNGDGTMRSASYLPISSGEPYVAVADFNGDGFQDLAYTCAVPCQNGGFILLLSDGAGGHQAPLTFPDPSATYNPTAIAVADFNGDGRPDVAVSEGSGDGVVDIFLNTGHGTFSEPLSLQGGFVTGSLATADFNGDGKPDLATLDSSGGTVTVLINNGEGSFLPPISTALPYGGYAMAPFYFNGSSHASLALVVPDTAYPIPGALAAEVMVGQGNGTFGVGDLYAAVGFSSSPAGIAVADVNRDGFPDLVVGASCDDPTTDASCTRGQVSVLLGQDNDTFGPVKIMVVQDGNLTGATVADLNGDGNPDIAASTLTGVLVSLGNGDGTFQSPTIYAGAENSVGQVAVADLNGDGLSDILQPSNYDQLAILYSQGPAPPRSVVTIQSSLDPSTFGQTTTLTSSVTSTLGSATGSVTFKDGAANLGAESLVGGSASLTTDALTAGVHSLSAAYGGNGTVPAGNSAGFYQLVNKASSSVTLTSTPHPLYVNQTVYLVAAVSSEYGGAVTGTVTFQDGATTLAKVAISGGRAVYKTTFAKAGQFAISAVYSGDGNNLTSTSSTLTVYVKQLPAATTTKLTTSGTPAFVGQPVTFTSTTTSTDGTVTNGVTVTFYDGSTQIGTGTTTGGVAQLTSSALVVGSHTINATFAGNTMYATSSGSLTQAIELYSSTITTTANPSASTYGQSVTFTANVTSAAPGGPTGTVKFSIGSTTLGTVALSGGTAALTIAKLPADPLTITSVYSGDGLSATSTTTTTEKVSKASTSTVVSSSVNPSKAGQTVRFSVVVTSTTTTPVGSVNFLDGSTVLATVTLAGGKATYSTSALAAGTHNITAVYTGTSNITGSTSAVLVQTVN